MKEITQTDREREMGGGRGEKYRTIINKTPKNSANKLSHRNVIIFHCVCVTTIFHKKWLNSIRLNDELLLILFHCILLDDFYERRSIDEVKIYRERRGKRMECFGYVRSCILKMLLLSIVVKSNSHSNGIYIEKIAYSRFFVVVVVVIKKLNLCKDASKLMLFIHLS